ncbi:sigma-54-dependent Fis family transcriptional regulator [Spirosoma sp. KNUC1025]|uniref:sigma-54 interaction domain-containing protein n=1 Tax=Spirosoma sp. KNUC1025 TaxID=2894082 RepID=UPI00386C5FFE|nr:sigma 54-interacting transcriptional regulator [Spirosoma sp. KNUC1025]
MSDTFTLQELIEQSELIQALNMEFAAVRDRQDLQKVLDEKLKGLFDFHSHFIELIKPDTLTVSMVSDEAENSPFRGWLTEQELRNDELTHNVLTTKEPVVVEVGQDFGEQKRFNFSSGTKINRLIQIRLSVREKAIGIWGICQRQNQNISAGHLRLIRQIANMLSIAVDSILANEEIKRREEEKSKILSFSNAIASASDKYTLGKIIGQQLDTLFNIHEYCIYIISRDEKWRWAFLFDRDTAIAKYPDFKELIELPQDNNDELYQVAKNATDVLLLTAEEYYRLPGTAPYREMGDAINFKGWGCHTIRLAQEDVAVLTFNHNNIHEMKPQLGLFKSICSQLAITASNLLSRDELERRENEKTILLSLSTEIASLKSREDLFTVVNAKIKEIFSITQFGIIKVDEDGKTHSAFMMDLGIPETYQADYEQVAKLKYSVTDSVFQNVMASDEPVVLDVNRLAAEKNPTEYVKFWKRVGFTSLVCFPLKTGGETIGAILLNRGAKPFMSAETHLLKGICAQLSVAVSNILANEKVINQLSEINRYKQQLEDEKVYLQEEIHTANNSADFIGSSPEIKKVLRLINTVAHTDSTVLLLGETGTGKELVARAIHNNSPRKNKLMVKVNCAALPASLIESELFGHERGSFTGALDRRIGKFELAHKGTLFLDEIGELPLEMQAKLLRVLQEKEIERVGGKTTINVDVRIIAATNRDLEKEMDEGRFRSDLFYRLNIFPIILPPLRVRQDDIPLLTSYFIKKFAKKTGKQVEATTNNVMLEMMRYSWPGNVRELEHLIERSVLLEMGQVIKQIHLPVPKTASNFQGDSTFQLTTIDDNERQHIFDTLTYCGGRITGAGGAAEILGVPPSTLHSKMKRLGIVRKHVV